MATSRAREQLAAKFEMLMDVCDNGVGPDAVREALVDIVAEYRPNTAGEPVGRES